MINIDEINRLIFKYEKIRAFLVRVTQFHGILVDFQESFSY